MPYVPSEKSPTPAPDRTIIDAALEPVARLIAAKIKSNLTLVAVYKKILEELGYNLTCEKNILSKQRQKRRLTPTEDLARAILAAAAPYKYEGAYLGEFNYACTRLIQRVPQIIAEKGSWKEEMRYWMWPATIQAFMCAAWDCKNSEDGISGVYLDVVLEYKRRVNTAYEAAQILKSGDCYDTPYYTRLVEVVEEDGAPIGHMEVMLKRSEKTLPLDVLEHQFVLRKKK